MDTTRSEKPQYLSSMAGAPAPRLLLCLLAPILAPLLFAAILAYICDSLVPYSTVKRLRSIATDGMALLRYVASLPGLLRHVRRCYVDIGVHHA